MYWESYFDESVQGLRSDRRQVSRRTGRNGGRDRFRGRYLCGEEPAKKTCCAMGAIFSSVDLLLIWTPHLTQEEKEAERGGRITAGLGSRLASQGVTGVV